MTYLLFMRRIVLDIQYHGQGFFGWQRQGDDRTVQSTVEAAVRDLVSHDVSVQGAGRTDRGVHAFAMPAHVDVDSRLTPREFMLALNHRLDDDLCVRRVREVDPRFHARFDVVSKHYRYTILNAQARSSILGDRSAQIPRPLDVAPMRVAGGILSGIHDFGAFQTNPDRDLPTEGTTEKTVDTVGPAAVALGGHDAPSWRKKRPQGTVRDCAIEIARDDELVVIDVRGSGFLRGMVRALAGTLVEIGLGKQPPKWAREVLESRDRREAGANLPAHGLALVSVSYPEEPFRNRRST